MGELSAIAVVALAAFLIVRAIVTRARHKRRRIQITVEWDDGSDDGD